MKLLHLTMVILVAWLIALPSELLFLVRQPDVDLDARLWDTSLESER